MSLKRSSSGTQSHTVEPHAFTFLNFWLILRPWRWRRYVPPKLWVTLNGLHGVISQKTELLLHTSLWIFWFLPFYKMTYYCCLSNVLQCNLPSRLQEILVPCSLHTQQVVFLLCSTEYENCLHVLNVRLTLHGILYGTVEMCVSFRLCEGLKLKHELELVASLLVSQSHHENSLANWMGIVFQDRSDLAF
jgi:hypothetical protein